MKEEEEESNRQSMNFFIKPWLFRALEEERKGYFETRTIEIQEKEEGGEEGYAVMQQPGNANVDRNRFVSLNSMTNRQRIAGTCAR